jgi:hypothetical protein
MLVRTHAMYHCPSHDGVDVVLFFILSLSFLLSHHTTPHRSLVYKHNETLDSK